MDKRYRISTLFISWGLLAGIMGYTIFQLLYFRDGSVNSNALIGAIILGVLLVILLIIFLLVLSKEELKQEIKLAKQQTRLEQQTEMIKLLREQRNDVRNAISVATSYLQLGKEAEALNYLEFIAAEQADEFNYYLVPEEAWSTIIKTKQLEAKELDIDFLVTLECDPPKETNEMRLLPRIVDNLVDNAFELVGGVDAPTVKLNWHCDHEKRVLEVSNNGPPLTLYEQEMVFASPSLSRDNTKGLSLVICRYIAAEIGGIISLESTPKHTVIRLQLQRQSN